MVAQKQKCQKTVKVKNDYDFISAERGVVDDEVLWLYE